MSKNLDETVRLQSEKIEEWIPEVRGDTLQGIIEGWSSAPHFANSAVLSLCERNECPATHCSLIIQEERKDSF